MLPALTSNMETGLLERPYGAPMRHARDAWHGPSDRNVDFSGLAATELLGDDRKIFADCIGDVSQCLLLRSPLRPAAWKTRN